MKNIETIIEEMNKPKPEVREVRIEKNDQNEKLILAALLEIKKLARQEIDIQPLIKAIKSIKPEVLIDNSGVRKAILELKSALKIKVNTPDVIVNTDKIEKAISKIKLNEASIDTSKLQEATENVETAIRSLRFPVPTPVTQIDVNPLRGVFKTTAVTVTTSATALPTSSLSNRRSIIVYNNDASVTLYIGGSDVSATNGVPVTAGTYSAPVDAGSSMTLYGIAASSINVRVLEMGNDAIGSS